MIVENVLVFVCLFSVLSYFGQNFVQQKPSISLIWRLFTSSCRTDKSYLNWSTVSQLTVWFVWNKYDWSFFFSGFQTRHILCPSWSPLFLVWMASWWKRKMIVQSWCPLTTCLVLLQSRYLLPSSPATLVRDPYYSLRFNELIKKIIVSDVCQCILSTPSIQNIMLNQWI